jgi:transposase
VIRLTDEQWERIRNHFPEENIADGRPGRKPVPTRRVLEAVLWILNTGAQWHMLPQSYPNYKTVHRRFQTWCCNEVLRRVLTDVANELRDRGALDEEECFIDATFVMAKGGGAEIHAQTCCHVSLLTQTLICEHRLWVRRWYCPRRGRRSRRSRGRRRWSRLARGSSGGLRRRLWNLHD